MEFVTLHCVGVHLLERGKEWEIAMHNSRGIVFFLHLLTMLAIAIPSVATDDSVLLQSNCDLNLRLLSNNCYAIPKPIRSRIGELMPRECAATYLLRPWWPIFCRSLW